MEPQSPPLFRSDLRKKEHSSVGTETKRQEIKLENMVKKAAVAGKKSRAEIETTGGNSAVGNAEHCIFPEHCSFGRSVDLDDPKDAVNMVCVKDVKGQHHVCKENTFAHAQCLEKWEEDTIKRLLKSGSARISNWSDRQLHTNLWNNKGMELTFRWRKCPCGGFLEKPTVSVLDDAGNVKQQVECTKKRKAAKAAPEKQKPKLTTPASHGFINKFCPPRLAADKPKVSNSSTTICSDEETESFYRPAPLVSDNADRLMPKCRSPLSNFPLHVDDNKEFPSMFSAGGRTDQSKVARSKCSGWSSADAEITTAAELIEAIRKLLIRKKVPALSAVDGALLELMNRAGVDLLVELDRLDGLLNWINAQSDCALTTDGENSIFVAKKTKRLADSYDKRKNKESKAVKAEGKCDEAPTICLLSSETQHPSVFDYDLSRHIEDVAVDIDVDAYRAISGDLVRIIKSLEQ